MRLIDTCYDCVYTFARMKSLIVISVKLIVTLAIEVSFATTFSQWDVVEAHPWILVVFIIVSTPGLFAFISAVVNKVFPVD